MALQSGQTVYSQITSTGDGYGFELAAPLYNELQLLAFAVRFPRAALQSHPWWVAKNTKLPLLTTGVPFLQAEPPWRQIRKRPAMPLLSIHREMA
jgi:hypothetical protein